MKAISQHMLDNKEADSNSADEQLLLKDYSIVVFVVDAAIFHYALLILDRAFGEVNIFH